MTASAPRRTSQFWEFLRTRSAYRTVLGLAAVAMALLLAVNLTTFFMIQRTADDYDRVEHTQQVRLTAREVMVWLLHAETGHRGFLLTGRREYLVTYEDALEQLPERLNTLVGLTLDNEAQNATAVEIKALAEDRVATLAGSMELARQGRGAEALTIVRRGVGSAQMEEVRQRVRTLDAREQELLAARTAASSASARNTIIVNSAAGLLILLLAAISFVVLRRSIGEIQAGQREVAALNQSLEAKVQERTGALSRANEEIQRFAYIVSHDLRSPLVNVMGYTSELEAAGKTVDLQLTKLESASPDLIEADAILAVREDMPEAIGFIRASTEKMDRLINAILKLSREGRKTLTPEPLDMTALVGRLGESVQHQLVEADGAFEVADLPTMENDRLSVEQIFGNLIDNAVKYLEPSRPLRISVTGQDRAGGWVEYRVTDNGRGIAERDHERIFELFRRSGRQDRPGEGLGLAFVRNSVRRLGGDISVESELGKGSTFVLKFPKRLVVNLGEDL